MKQHPIRAHTIDHRRGKDIDAVIEELHGLAAGVDPLMLETTGCRRHSVPRPGGRRCPPA